MTIKELDFAGRKLSFTTDYLALQASGSVLARFGDTVVLAAAVMGKERPEIDFFPLLVDYEERLYAMGRIRGSRFMKREGRPGDDAILTGRVIDRGLRPLFDSDIRTDIQVVVTVLSVDELNDPDVIAANAASAALSVSNIPWNGPLGTVRVGRVEGEFVINPTFEQRGKSELDLVVSSTGEHVLMVEAGAEQVSEQIVTDALKFSQPYLKQLVDFQNELVKQTGKVKIDVLKFAVRDEIKEIIEQLKAKIVDTLYNAAHKELRENGLKQLRKELLAGVSEKFEGDDKAELEAGIAFDKKTKEIIRQNILDSEKRVDGRPLNVTRQVTSEVGILPRTHGSALFSRGETQVLTTVTLGSPGEEQTLEGVEEFMLAKKRYIHHYNMPGYSTGEVAPVRGPGRREIGHGALAERALSGVIPEKEKFPYTIRLVSEVLSSNGSTSMASTCGSTLALMDAGVPVKAIIGGVAMGLVLDIGSGKFKVLTDIQGIEDNNGDMDFKVAGSETGITALQMDVKTRGVTVEILEQALVQAKEGRLHILSAMKQAIMEPRAELSKFAPRITTFTIPSDKIGTVIGPGGKVINEIIDATGVKIDIDDDGLVMITSTDAEQAEKATSWVKNLVREVKVGEEFKGKVTRVMDFGAFVEILPGKEGMVHVSKLKAGRVENVSDVVKPGDELEVVVSEIDPQGRINLITKEAMAAGKSGERSPRPGGGRRFSNDKGRGRD